MNVLIVGGTSGIGLQLGIELKAMGSRVFVTGRHVEKAQEHGLTPFILNIGRDYRDLRWRADYLVERLPTIDLYVHAAGFYQEGFINKLSEEEVLTAVNISLVAPVFILQRLMRKQGTLDGFIAITSTSATRAREKEPLYCSTKSALSMLAWTLSYDPRVRRILELKSLRRQRTRRSGAGGRRTESGCSPSPGLWRKYCRSGAAPSATEASSCNATPTRCLSRKMNENRSLTPPFPRAVLFYTSSPKR
ncbi:SDR family oxidoreductase [Candidatus Kaiserbacteria bacterium]|nr:SDR family oxidoreductase [Candidatus Kaiserbacteria bacterium]